MRSCTDAPVRTGLSEPEAQERLKAEGFNELGSTRKRSSLAMAFDVVREPMFILLIICGGIYLILGEIPDAMMLLAFVFIIIGITIYQEHKTERTLEALKDLSSPRALVIRDGTERRIVGREVVRDDLFVVTEGDRIPADALLLDTKYMSVDESLLTGESVPVRKVATENESGMSRPGGDDQPYLYSGTLVIKGKGVARVTATGPRTEMGKIGKAIESIGKEKTPLSLQTGRLVRNVAIVGFVLCTLVIVMYGLTRGAWLDGILAGITLAMAMVPEEFPVVLSVFLALGAWRMAQKHVLTRRVPAIEALGAAQVLCVDKTGTLTQNKMTVSKLIAQGEVFDATDASANSLPETFHELMEFSVLASHLDPFDPMEKAFIQFGDQYLSNTDHLHKNWRLEREYPLSGQLLAMSHVWSASESDELIIATKGAPEAIADLCHFDGPQSETLATDVDRLAREGLRVLAVAKARPTGAEMPQEQHSTSNSSDWSASRTRCGPQYKTPSGNATPLAFASL